MTDQQHKIRITPPARTDITSQASYYRQHVSSALAQQWQVAVSQTILSLTSMPQRGGYFSLESVPNHRYRRISVSGFPHHAVIYRVDSIKVTVTVVAVLHGARDAGQVLLSHRI